MLHGLAPLAAVVKLFSSLFCAGVVLSFTDRKLLAFVVFFATLFFLFW